jgi:hypothetical protein
VSARATVTVTANEADMIDHGAPIFSATRTFVLFWGDATAFPADARVAVETLLSGLRGSSYLAILDQYTRGASASTTWAGTFFDASAPTASADATAIGGAACRALAANGIVPTAGDFVLVSTSNFPSDMAGCAWHAWTTCGGQQIVFAYAPNPEGSRCGTTTHDICESGYSSATTDLVLSTAHELFESMTDPFSFSTAWRSTFGFEMMDGCGSIACARLSTRVTPVPTAWSNAVHTCVSQAQ